MFANARLPGSAFDEPTTILRRAIWFAVRRRIHYAEVASNLAKIYAAGENAKGADSFLKHYIRLSDPAQDDAEDGFIERSKETLRRINEDGAKLEIRFSDEEIREAHRDQQRVKRGKLYPPGNK